MGYFKRDHNQIAQRFLSRLLQLTPITYIGEGSIARAFLEIIAEELGDVYAIFDYNISQCLVTTAQGPALDALGEIWGIYRTWNTSPPDIQSFYFYLNSSPNHEIGYSDMQATTSFTIPAGTIVSTDIGHIGDRMSFTTKTSIEFNIGDSVKYVDLAPNVATILTNIGKNKLTSHNYTGTSSGYVYCTNPKELNVNTKREEDDVYRERILAAVQSIASANTTAVRIAALSANHVRDVNVIDRPYGPGTARVIIDADIPAYETEALAGATNNVEEAKPLGLKVSVELAEKLPANIQYVMATKPGASNDAIRRLVNANITSYINSLRIGEPFYISSVIDRAMNTSSDIKDIQISAASIVNSQLIKTVYKPKETQIIVPGVIDQSSTSTYTY